VICQNKLGKLAEYLHVVDNSFPLEAASFATLFTNSIDGRIRDILRTYHTILLFSYSRQLKETIETCTARRVYQIFPRPEPGRKIHVSAHIVSVLAALDLLPRDAGSTDPLVFPHMHMDLRSIDYEPHKICIHPGSGSPKKNWPLPNFIKICEVLKSNGKKPEFILGPAEGEFTNALRGSEWILHSISDLVELAALLKTAGGFIGNDSGVSHLAGFLGLPTVAVFGPSDPLRWRPAGRAVESVRADLDCRPCFEKSPHDCRDMDCLNSLTPQCILNTFIKLYRRKSFQ
jgi:ADP-heptose:LPS heptosyltransferase